MGTIHTLASNGNIKGIKAAPTGEEQRKQNTNEQNHNKTHKS